MPCIPHQIGRTHASNIKDTYYMLCFKWLGFYPSFNFLRSNLCPQKIFLYSNSKKVLGNSNPLKLFQQTEQFLLILICKIVLTISQKPCIKGPIDPPLPLDRPFWIKEGFVKYFKIPFNGNEKTISVDQITLSLHAFWSKICPMKLRVNLNLSTIKPYHRLQKAF